MKKYIVITILAAGILLINHSCTDIQGDGIDTIEYQGSQVPENFSYRNPVWNFDLTKASVFLSSGPFYAFGEEKAWAEGINFTVPVLTSSNLMNWSLIEQGEAFIEKPSWAEGTVSSVTGFFSKSLGMYYLFYMLGDGGIGAADARTPQGPYVDYGKVTDKDALGVAQLSDPFVYALGSSFYLFFTVADDGVYGVRLSIIKNNRPTINGTPVKITGPGYSGVLVRKKGSTYWFYGTQDGNIVTAKSTDITGPYVNKSGASLVEEGGEPIVIPTGEYGELGQVAGVQVDKAGNDWILYTAVDTEIPDLPTGERRFVLMLNQPQLDDQGWPVQPVEARSGYFTPRFEN